VAREHPQHRVADPNRCGFVVLEEWRHVPRRIRQREPELHAVQGGRRGGRHLRVLDAAAGGHQVHLAGVDEGDGARRIAMLDLAGEEPAHGLQTGPPSGTSRGSSTSSPSPAAGATSVSTGSFSRLLTPGSLDRVARLRLLTLRLQLLTECCAAFPRVAGAVELPLDRS
jgi:hypothetical protein